MDIPKRMKALIKKEENEGYACEEVDTPEPSNAEVLVKVDAVAICGSDINLYKWNDVARVIAKVPFIPGHEATGIVVKCGPEATIKVGQRIAVENHFFCEQCYQCEHDRRDICQNMGQYGHGKKTMHGGCCQYSIVESKYCYPITKGLSPDEAVLLEPLGVSHNAIEQLKVKGEDVLVIGCGAVGLLAIAVCKALGAGRVIGADIQRERLELAAKMGADVTINTLNENLKEVIMKLTNDNGIGRIAEMSGSDSMVNSMFSLLRKGGQISMVGLPKKPLHVENVLQDVVFKSLSLNTIHGRRIFHTWEEIESLVAEKKVDVTKILSHRLPMSRYEEAFDALFGGNASKIILYPQE